MSKIQELECHIARVKEANMANARERIDTCLRQIVVVLKDQETKIQQLQKG